MFSDFNNLPLDYYNLNKSWQNFVLYFRVNKINFLIYDNYTTKKSVRTHLLQKPLLLRNIYHYKSFSVS